MTKVYWVFDLTCKKPEIDGYVGITNGDPKRRHSAHVRRGVAPRGSSLRILFEGTREECKTWENRLRPRPDLGWNKAIGGIETGGMLGRNHTEETKATMAKKRREWHSNHRGWSQSEKAKQTISAALRGQAKPPGHSEKLRALASRRFRVYRDDGSWTWGYRD